MAKRYDVLELQNVSLVQVREALARAVGPLCDQWMSSHMMGIHLDILDVSHAVAFGAAWEAGHPDQPVDVQVVHVFLWSRPELGMLDVQRCLAGAIAARLQAELGVEVGFQANGD